MIRISRRRRTRRAAAIGAIAALTFANTASASAAASHALIQGSGSSWSANAVNQWVADVQTNGLQVVFTPNGSAQGRKDFAYKTTDFGVSDIGYQGQDPVTGEADTAQGRAFVYLPIVAGGTAFPYHIEVGGKLVRNLRLSGATIAKIFTNQITNWNDSAITADNNGRKLPSKPIIPVVHSEGSGSTAQFTTYLNADFGGLWSSYLGRATFTEYYPRKGAQKAQNGSDGVMNFIASGAADGAIGYDEYSYALAKNYPVAKMLNSNGYYTLPNQYNVAVALTRAIIDPTSLLQDLRNVYTYDAPQVYPLSSYSYAIIPTGATDARMTTAKRQTLADFLFYSVCGGQREMGPIGYSPLPLNLVQASFNQVAKLKTADPGVNVSTQSPQNCNNPTFDPHNTARNYLAEIAPVPPACDHQGQGPCTATVDSGTANPDSNGAPPAVNGSSSAGGGGGSNGGGAAANGGTGGSGSGGANGTAGGSSSGAGGTVRAVPRNGASANGRNGSTATKIDPVTGQLVNAGTGDTSSDASANPVDLAANPHTENTTLFGLLAALLLVLALALPPIVAIRLSKRRERP
jgi:phosphate ABC transporter phosphate-binding protein